MKKIFIMVVTMATLTACGGPSNNSRIAGCENKTLGDLKDYAQSYEMDGNVLTMTGTHNNNKYHMIYELEKDGKMHFKNFVSDDNEANGISMLIPSALATGMCAQLNR